MVHINVAQLLKEPIGSTRDYEVSSNVDIMGDGVSKTVQGEVKFTRTHRGILAQGKINTEVELWCSRCLSSFSCPLTLGIEEEYFPVIDVTTGLAISLSDEPGSFIINYRHILDLTEAIRQNALLAIPMKPLCRADCAGLCPNCGCNINIESCECQPEEDHRWAKLRSMVSTGWHNEQEGME